MNSKQTEIAQSTLYNNIHDAVISIVLESNCNLNQRQINKLHNLFPSNQQQTKIISKPSQDDENKNYNKIVTYEFDDEHIIMLKLFGRWPRYVNWLLGVINSKCIQASLLLMVLTNAFLDLLVNNGVCNRNVRYIYATVMWVIIMFYTLVWILYANKHAMKLLFKQFVFIFKLCYLILFIVTEIWIEYVANMWPMYFIVAWLMGFGMLLFLVMIFDAINVSQTNKILISTLTVGVFSMHTLLLRQYDYYPNKYVMYHKANIIINNINYFVFSDIKISLLSISSNSAWILTIFLLQQVIRTIFYPTQSLVIKSKAFIKYTNNKNKIPTTKHLTLWRCVCVGYIFWGLLYNTLSVWPITRMNGTLTMYIVNIFAMCNLLCLLVKNNIKSLKTATIIWFVFCIINGIAAFLHLINAMIVCGTFIGFGLFSGYLLKLKKSANNSMNILHEQNVINNTKVETQSDVELKKHRECCINMEPAKEIEMKNVKKDNGWTNIDRRESINSVNLNRAQSTAL